MWDIVGDKQLQYIHCPILQDVNAIRQWNFVSWLIILWEFFFLKNYTPNVVKKQNNQNWGYL